MSVREMPLEEKYDKLFDDTMVTTATALAVIKEVGATDKYIDLSVKAQKKMLPSFLGMAAFKVLKAVAPGSAFNKLTDQFMYSLQNMHPLSNIELTKVSDREVAIRIKNCPAVKRMRDIIEKTGLDIDPRFMCGTEARIFPEVLRGFGVDLALELEENGCMFKGRLK